jgi:hypothetical protein
MRIIRRIYIITGPISKIRIIIIVVRKTLYGITKSRNTDLRNLLLRPLLSSNCDVYARVSAAFILPMPVLFAFASHYFLRSFFASTTAISRVYCDSNFLVYLLLQVEDRIEVGAVTGT